MTIEFTVEVEGINIGHAGDMVEHTLEAMIDRLRAHIILLRDNIEQKVGIISIRIDHRLYEGLQEERDDTIAGEFDIHHHRGVIDTAEGDLRALAISLLEIGREAIDEIVMERATQDLLLMLHKSIGTPLDEDTDHTGAEISHLLIGIGEAIYDMAHMVVTFGGEEIEEKRSHQFCGEKMEFVGILDIHNLIADIIGSLKDID